MTEYTAHKVMDRWYGEVKRLRQKHQIPFSWALVLCNILHPRLYLERKGAELCIRSATKSQAEKNTDDKMSWALALQRTARTQEEKQYAQRAVYEARMALSPEGKRPFMRKCLEYSEKHREFSWGFVMQECARLHPEEYQQYRGAKAVARKQNSKHADIVLT